MELYRVMFWDTSGRRRTQFAEAYSKEEAVEAVKACNIVFFRELIEAEKFAPPHEVQPE